MSSLLQRIHSLGKTSAIKGAIIGFWFGFFSTGACYIVYPIVFSVLVSSPFKKDWVPFFGALFLSAVIVLSWVVGVFASAYTSDSDDAIGTLLVSWIMTPCVIGGIIGTILDIFKMKTAGEVLVESCDGVFLY